MGETIVQRIKKSIKADTVIPKPEAKANFIVKGWGIRRGEEALIYLIPNHNNPHKPYPKGINVSEWEKAYDQITSKNEFSRQWFNQNMPACANEGGCNFTTIGGIFELLGIAEYERGVYRFRHTHRI